MKTLLSEEQLKQGIRQLAENIQKHYMIPHDEQKRAEMFEDVAKTI